MLESPDGPSPYAIHLMNAWLQMLGIDAIKPLLTALLLPPVPWLLLMLLGGWLMGRRRWLGWSLLLAGATLTWFGSTAAGADVVTHWLLNPPPAVRDPRALATPLPAGQTVIVVLGGGRSRVAEYPETTLSTLSMERLRYGVWLSRQTGLPLAFSGGLSPGSVDGPSEAALATRIARDEFRHPLRWAEERSRDTHENALRMVDLLRDQGVGRLVLVTHDLHMPRSLAHFRQARDAAGLRFEIVPAPTGMPYRVHDRGLVDFYPTPGGIARFRYAVREWLGILAGA